MLHGKAVRKMTIKSFNQVENCKNTHIGAYVILRLPKLTEIVVNQEIEGDVQSLDSKCSASVQ